MTEKYAYIIHDMKGERGELPWHVCEAGPGSFQWKRTCGVRQHLRHHARDH